MSTEHELSRRLATAAERIDADPDLDAVVGRSLRTRTRMRRLAGVGAAVVATVGVGALVVVANRETRAPSDRPPVVATAPPSIDRTDDGSNGAADTTPPSTDAPAAPPTETRPASTASTPPTPDPADPYLDQTVILYDQVTDDDERFVIRLSDTSYGELFDIEWTAPTGSVEECLGGPALLSGDPNRARQSGAEESSWLVYPLTALSETRPTDVVQTASPFAFDPSGESIASVFVVRTLLPVTSLVVEGDGVTSAQAEFVDGVAAIEVVSELVPDEPGSAMRTPQFDTATLSLEAQPGAEVDPAQLTLPLFDLDGLAQLPAACLPPSPSTELPPSGQQPADPASAEASIRERFALAVDTSIPFGDKPDDLFDSAEGVEDAIERALDGPNSEYVSAANYEMVDLVFTSPDEAWFSYDIDALGVMFRPFGRATFDGTSWQIGRDTICQDLARVGAQCDPAPSEETVTPPSDPATPPPPELTDDELDAYRISLTCHPLRPCELP